MGRSTNQTSCKNNSIIHLKTKNFNRTIRTARPNVKTSHANTHYINTMKAIKNWCCFQNIGFKLRRVLAHIHLKQVTRFDELCIQCSGLFGGYICSFHHGIFATSCVAGSSYYYLDVDRLDIMSCWVFPEACTSRRYIPQVNSVVLYIFVYILK